MPRPSDCIYCGAETGSREHTFPAALGGRRMNKGILCATCNEGFSKLDKALSDQLGFLNGIIGVRPDRSSVPRKARMESPQGPLLVDAAGKPTIAKPKVVADEDAGNG